MPLDLHAGRDRLDLIEQFEEAVIVPEDVLALTERQPVPATDAPLTEELDS